MKSPAFESLKMLKPIILWDLHILCNVKCFIKFHTASSYYRLIVGSSVYQRDSLKTKIIPEICNLLCTLRVEKFPFQPLEVKTTLITLMHVGKMNKKATKCPVLLQNTYTNWESVLHRNIL